MTNSHLTAILAERVMDWRVGPDRFLTGDRHWLPRSRFDPTADLNHAFRLLQEARPARYMMGAEGDGKFWVRVEIEGTIGEAQHTSKPQAISFAIARAIGLKVGTAE